MELYIILGVVVLGAFIIIGVLFFMLSKEGHKKEEDAVPLTDLEQLKKELYSGLLEPQKPKANDHYPDIIPPFEPKVSLPTQDVLVPAKDDVYKKRVEELEEELNAIRQKADGQSGEARQLIETLTKENESLKSQQANLEQAQQKIVELQGEASDLKTENTGLQTQLELTNSKVHQLEAEMASVKIQMGEEISRAKELVSELIREKEALSAAPKPQEDQSLNQELENLKSEQALLKQKYEDLEISHQKISELNKQLIEKNDLLQYELVKARAQSSGLERVSFNYKNQLEDFFKKVNAIQETNDHLSQAKNRLEGMVAQVNLQNEELTQKDHLAQFELEKNRTRLLTLERDFEDLKARMQQNNQ